MNNRKNKVLLKLKRNCYRKLGFLNLIMTVTSLVKGCLTSLVNKETNKMKLLLVAS